MKNQEIFRNPQKSPEIFRIQRSEIFRKSSEIRKSSENGPQYIFALQVNVHKVCGRPKIQTVMITVCYELCNFVLLLQEYFLKEQLHGPISYSAIGNNR